jgi:hypothetical protein
VEYNHGHCAMATRDGFWAGAAHPHTTVHGAGMNPIESKTHSFIIKVWLEETVEEAGRATWRGYITHVLSGERRYLQDLSDVTAFVASYLEEMGVKLGLWRRLRQWLKEKK